MKRSYINTAVKAALLVPAMGMIAPLASAQESDDNVEVIEVRGIVSSLKRAMSDKKESAIVSDGIAAEDLGKFPDLNVAESLQRITGVSIDRDGGEGQQVTVRGLGPQFNAVLVNGRQIATESPGREFNFDVLAADQITGANVYKSGNSALQEGGIGATIEVTTARPFDFDGFRATASVKGVYETLSEETSPAVSGLISNTWNDGKMGALLAVSHQERDVQINRIETAGWRPGLTISNTLRDANGQIIPDANGNPQTTVLASNVYLPRNWDQIVDQQERTRSNANLVFQFAPSEEVTVTLDGYVSKFEVDSLVTDLASWFEPDRINEVEVDAATNTAVFFTQDVNAFGSSGNPATDFVSHTRNSRDISNSGFGLNVDWAINDQLTATFDAHSSKAENDRAGKDRFNVIGIINSYQFDGRGGTPTVTHDGFGNGNLPDASLARMHYNEKGNRFTDEDEITEFKADFEYTPDSDTWRKGRFGVLRQEREKSSFQIFGNQCAFCGYGTAAPDGFVTPFTAQNFFPGLIDTWYTYDGDALVEYLASTGNPIVPTLQGNRYTINEDVTSLYMDFDFIYDVGDMPLSVNVGARYAETSIDVAAIQAPIIDVVPTTDLTLFSNVFGPEQGISDGGSYSDLLTNLNIKLELSDDMLVRFAMYDSLTRPTMAELSPATIFGEPRRQNLAASGGNPNLDPIESDNYDISFEWYYGDASAFTIAMFRKEVEGFISVGTFSETYALTNRQGPDFFCDPSSSALCDLDTTTPEIAAAIPTTEELNGQSEVYTVSRPSNGVDSTINGLEIAWTHVWENGFGISLNATKVDSDTDEGSGFAIEGLGDSQNAVVFYEKDGFQARVAFNNREGFLRRLDNGFNGEPVNTGTFGQWDISASYDINETFTVFFEGINITEEELEQYGRFETQVYNIEDNGSRYALGVRANF